MSETKFLNFVLFEGIFLIILGIFMLLSPKITPLSFGFSMCISTLVFGCFKTITSFVNKTVSKFYLADMVIGLIMTVVGVFLFFAPAIDIMLTIGLVGIYFILQSISSTAFGIRSRQTFQIWWINYIAAFLEIFFGIVVIIALSPASMWLAGVLVGLDFLIRGFFYINLNLSKEYVIV